MSEFIGNFEHGFIPREEGMNCEHSQAGACSFCYGALKAENVRLTQVVEKMQDTIFNHSSIHFVSLCICCSTSWKILGELAKALSTKPSTEDSK